MTRTWSTLAILLGLAFAGCRAGDGLVVVSVDSMTPIEVATLRVTATIGQRTSQFDVSAGATIPPATSFGIQVPARLSGLMSVALQALDGSGTPLATASGQVHVSAGERADLALTFGAPSVGPDGGDMSAGDMSAGDETPDAGPSASLELVAGQLGGSGTVDGTGAAARFGSPGGLVSDGNGHLYVADSSNHTIRKIDVATGVVTTVAGSAQTAGSADGKGAAARFSSPSGVTLDGHGNLFVADTANHTIRRVVLDTGVVSTLAGTPESSGSTDGKGAAARFSSPSGIASNGSGRLFVADTSNDTIRVIDTETGAVTTLAGTARMPGSTDDKGAAARFNRPRGIAFDGIGNLFIADTGNHTIRRCVITTGQVTTLAGQAGMYGSTDGTGTAARFYAPSAITIDAAGNLFVADTSNRAIRKIDHATSLVTTLAKAGSLDSLQAIALDANDVYVADADDHVIRKLAVPTGEVTTLAGALRTVGSADGMGTTARFSTPYGIASDGAGNLYIADSSNNTIRELVAATGEVTTLAGAAGMSGSADGQGTAARFSYPMGIACDGAGNLYIADSSNNTIRELVPASGAVTTLAGAAGMPPGSADGRGAAARFRGPSGIAVDDAGNLYIADSQNHTIRELVVATGDVTTVAGTAEMAGDTDGVGPVARFNSPTSVALDGHGNLYVADWGNQTVRKIVLAQRSVTTLAGAPGVAGSTDGTGAAARFAYPFGVTAGGMGDSLYVSDMVNSTVRKIALPQGEVSTVVGVAAQVGVVPGPLPATLNRPGGIVAIPGGLAILDGAENAVLIARGL